jgi:hypothetical protein
MVGTTVPVEVTVAVIGAAASVFVAALSSLVANVKERRNRKRDTYGQAFRAVAMYKEYPYIIRRRRGGDEQVAANERARIAEELRKVQEDLSYFTGWVGTESPRVASTYRELVRRTRVIAGSQMREAWLADPNTTDSGMNMPDLGLQHLQPYEEAFLNEASNNLVSLPTRWWRALRKPKNLVVD